MRKLFVLLFAAASLMFSFYTCSAEENAAAIYKEIVSDWKGMPTPEDFDALWQKTSQGNWDDSKDKVSNLISQNKEQLQIFRDAAVQKNYDITFGKPKRFYEKLGAELPKYEDEIMLSKLTIMEGKCFENEKRYADALLDYLSVLKVADQIRSQTEFRSLLNGVVGLILQEITFTALDRLMKNEDINSGLYQELLSYLDTFAIENYGLVASLQAEFDYLDKVIPDLRRKLKEDIDWHGIDDASKEKCLDDMLAEQQRLEEEAQHHALVAAKENDLDYYNKKIDALFDKTSNEVKLHNIVIDIVKTEIKDIFGLTHNDVNSGTLAGKIVFLIAYPRYTRIIRKFYFVGTRLNLLKIGSAIKLYQIDNKRLPNTLDELAPMYIKSIPVDDFNRPNQLKYNTKDGKAIVYSIGPDRVDGSALKICAGDECWYGDKEGDIVLEVK